MSNTAAGHGAHRTMETHPVSWEPLSLDAIDDDPVLFGRARDYWDRIRGDRWAPSRDDISPAEIVGVLPHLLMVDVIWPGPRYRYRLAGTASAEIHGIDLTGHYIEKLRPADYASQLKTQLDVVVETRSLQFIRWLFVNKEENQRDYRVLRLPLSSDGRSVDKIVMVADFMRLSEPLGIVSLESA